MSQTLRKVKVNTNFGPVDFRYDICTPTDVSASCVDPAVPTILFLHSEYIAAETWQNQFHSSLRRFNLVAFDFRSHGDTEASVPSGYSRVEGTAETSIIMDALGLPPCHIVGSSMGADIGLQLAIDFPKKILSATLIAPLPEKENEDVTSARQELVDSWASDDKEMAMLALSGTLQLVNNMNCPLVKSFVPLQVPRGRRNWNPSTRDTFQNICVKYFQINRSREPGTYEKIQCPILLLNCTEDVAASDAPQLYRELRQAGVSAELVDLVGAPRLAHVTHPSQVNDAIEKFIIPLCPGGVAPPVPQVITTPWESALRSFGWESDTESNSSDEGDYIYVLD